MVVPREAMPAVISERAIGRTSAADISASASALPEPPIHKDSMGARDSFAVTAFSKIADRSIHAAVARLTRPCGRA